MTVSGTPGTGTITLLAAAAGFQTFASAGVANGDVVSYVIEDGTNWEYGQGTYTSSGTTLTRTTVQGSSNAGSAISATSSALVFVSALASDLGAVVTAYTPTVTSSSGTITTLGAVAGTYTQIGKVVIFSANAAITTNGTASGELRITLPVTPDTSGSQAFSGLGYESAVTGNKLLWSNKGSQSFASVWDMSQSYPGADGRRFHINGMYFVP